MTKRTTTKRTTTKRTATKRRAPDGNTGEPLSLRAARRIGRGAINLIPDPDAPGNWWVADAANPYLAGSYAPMSRAELLAFLAERR